MVAGSEKLKIRREEVLREMRYVFRGLYPLQVMKSTGKNEIFWEKRKKKSVFYKKEFVKYRFKYKL